MRFLRLQGDPHSIARGIALGIFIGITPTLPLHTILIFIFSYVFRANLIAGILAATVVSNPLTFALQYYFSWYIGDMLLPCHISWETIKNLLELVTSDASFKESLMAVTNLGKNAGITLILGGIILAIPFTLTGYFGSLFLIIRFRQRRYRKHKLS